MADSSSTDASFDTNADRLRLAKNAWLAFRSSSAVNMITFISG